VAELESPKVVRDLNDVLDNFAREQSAGFARIETKLDDKAGKDDVIRLETKLEHLDTRVDAVERKQRDADTARRSSRDSYERQTNRRDKRNDALIALLGVILTTLLVLGTFGVRF